MDRLVLDVFGGESSRGRGHLWRRLCPPGPELGPEWWRQEAGVRGLEAGRSVVVKHFSEVGWGLIVEHC